MVSVWVSLGAAALVLVVVSAGYISLINQLNGQARRYVREISSLDERLQLEGKRYGIVYRSLEDVKQELGRQVVENGRLSAFLQEEMRDRRNLERRVASLERENDQLRAHNNLLAQRLGTSPLPPRE